MAWCLSSVTIKGNDINFFYYHTCINFGSHWGEQPGWEFFSSPPRPEWPRGPPSLLSNGYQGLFHWEWSGRDVKLTIHLHLVPRSRMRGAIPPLPQYAFTAWYSVKAEGQLYTITYFRARGTKVKLSLCLTKHHAMKTYWGSGGIAPHILDLGTRWRWMVSFTSRQLYLQGKNPLYPLDRRLGGPQSRSGRGGEEKNSQPLPGLNPDRQARSPALYRLSHHGSMVRGRARKTFRTAKSALPSRAVWVTATWLQLLSA
jgi:hypothetical protein